MTTPSSALVLEARGLVKRYGHVTALDGADFELLPGEILAVIGDNGAGKSTLIKALSGALVPDEGEMFLDGKPVKFHTPIDARRHGIETVYQDLALAPAMTIAENLFLGREIRRPGLLGSLLRLLDKKKMDAEAIAHLKDLQIGIGSMNAGRRNPVGRSTAGCGGGAQRGVRAPRRDHGRTDGGARRQRVQHGARLDSPRARPGPAGDSRQPQHAARVRGGRSDSHPAAGPARRVGEGARHQDADAVAIMTGAIVAAS